MLWQWQIGNEASMWKSTCQPGVAKASVVYDTALICLNL